MRFICTTCLEIPAANAVSSSDEPCPACGHDGLSPFSVVECPACRYWAVTEDETVFRETHQCTEQGRELVAEDGA